MKSHKNSNIAFKWLVLFFFCWVVTQFLGYQHRITHSVSQQNHVLESSQYHSPTQEQLQLTLGESPEVEHHCGALDHGALGLGLALGLLAFEILLARFIFKPSLCYKGQFSLFFSPYLSRAPPATF
jgi:hypothetical protein